MSNELYDEAVRLDQTARKLYDERQLDEAETYQAKALDIVRRLAQQDPETYNPILAIYLNNSGQIYYSMDRQYEAGVQFKQAWDIFYNMPDEQYKEHRANANIIYNNFSMTSGYWGMKVEEMCRDAREENDYGKARNIFEKAIDITISTGVGDLMLAYVYLDFAMMLQKNGRYDEAETVYNRSVELLRPKMKDYSDIYKPVLAQTIAHLAFLKYEIKDYVHSEQLLKEALTLYEGLKHGSYGSYDSYIADIRKYLDALPK